MADEMVDINKGGSGGSKGSGGNTKLKGFELKIAKTFGYDIDNPNEDIAKLAKSLSVAIKAEIDRRIEEAKK